MSASAQQRLREPAPPKSSAEPPHSPAAQPAHLDAAGRIALLSEAFEDTADRVAPAESTAELPRPAARLSVLRSHYRRVLKSLIGLVVVIAAGWMPVRALLQTTSTEAIINARLITLRAPISGQVRGLGAVAIGSDVQPGALLIDISNPRADRGRLDDINRMMVETEIEVRALRVRRDHLAKLQADLFAQSGAFEAARIKRLEARVAELGSELLAAAARRDEAAQALARAEALHASGNVSAVAVEKAIRDATVAAQAHAALAHRRAGEEVELAAIRRGVFVGDSYNDRPQSVQRADEIALRLADLEADITQREARLTALRNEHHLEQTKLAERAGAQLVAPVRGSIWEIMTAPGESVVLGQDLVRVLDCTGLVVTATVGETAYNALKIGDPAHFRFKGESADIPGRIIGLTGVATAPANLAIQPSALAREPYRVTVALPELARAETCPVGRTGRITFTK